MNIINVRHPVSTLDAQNDALNQEIVACRRCPRLIEYCADVARIRRRAYREQEYWGKPVPSFGGADARMLIFGLAPGAHGANRTGRVFTGDSSGDLLYRVLHATGFASQPESSSLGDGLALIRARISCAAHCAPPDNKPAPGELKNCRYWLERELELLSDLRVVVVLGKIAFDSYLTALRQRGAVDRISAYSFGHNKLYALKPLLIASYHPSQQNTSTGRLTESMLHDVFAQAREICV